jgi:hypothetical protein
MRCKGRKGRGRCYDLEPQCGQNFAVATGLTWPQLRQLGPALARGAARPTELPRRDDSAPTEGGLVITTWLSFCTVSVNMLILACKSSPPPS